MNLSKSVKNSKIFNYDLFKDFICYQLELRLKRKRFDKGYNGFLVKIMLILSFWTFNWSIEYLQSFWRYWSIYKVLLSNFVIGSYKYCHSFIYKTVFYYFLKIMIHGMFSSFFSPIQLPYTT